MADLRQSTARRPARATRVAQGAGLAATQFSQS
jgi:hypothetical protein